MSASISSTVTGLPSLDRIDNMRQKLLDKLPPEDLTARVLVWQTTHTVRAVLSDLIDGGPAQWDVEIRVWSPLSPSRGECSGSAGIRVIINPLPVEYQNGPGLPVRGVHPAGVDTPGGEWATRDEDLGSVALSQR